MSIKIERAKKLFSGHKPAVSEILQFIDGDLISQLSSKQLAAVFEAMDNSFHAGKRKAEIEIATDQIYCDNNGKLWEIMDKKLLN